MSQINTSWKALEAAAEGYATKTIELGSWRDVMHSDLLELFRGQVENAFIAGYNAASQKHLEELMERA